MSQENVEIVRGMYRQGDPSQFFALLADEVEVDATEVGLLPDHPGLIRGKDAVMDYFRHYWGAWHDYLLEPSEILEGVEDRVVVVHYERGSGRGSGAPFERSWATVYTVRGGKVVRFKAFVTREEALEAAGLSE